MFSLIGFKRTIFRNMFFQMVLRGRLRMHQTLIIDVSCKPLIINLILLKDSCQWGIIGYRRPLEAN